MSECSKIGRVGETVNMIDTRAIFRLDLGFYMDYILGFTKVLIWNPCPSGQPIIFLTVALHAKTQLVLQPGHARPWRLEMAQDWAWRLALVDECLYGSKYLKYIYFAA